MEKKESRNANNMKNQNIENKGLKPSAGKRSKSDKSLPWWVELLFVQIGLPDKYLIKILKTNKNFKELFKSEKQFLSAFLVIFNWSDLLFSGLVSTTILFLPNFL